jgi:hypothetical protein
VNTKDLKQIIDNPAASAREKETARKRLTEMGEEHTQETSDYWFGPTLAELLPDRFPAKTENAFRRIRKFIASIPLGGLAKEVLSDYRMTCALDIDALSLDAVERYRKHADQPKLKALLDAAKELARAEYFMDDAYGESEKSLSCFSLTQKRGAELADWIYTRLRKSQIAYECAATFFPPETKPILPMRRPLEPEFAATFGLIAAGVR